MKTLRNNVSEPLFTLSPGESNDIQAVKGWKVSMVISGAQICSIQFGT